VQEQSGFGDIGQSESLADSQVNKLYANSYNIPQPYGQPRAHKLNGFDDPPVQEASRAAQTDYHRYEPINAFEDDPLIYGRTSSHLQSSSRPSSKYTYYDSNMVKK